MASNPTKQQRIKQTFQATKARRKIQFCRVYELKLTKAKLSPRSRAHLARLFLEAKWCYNFLVSQEDLFKPEAEPFYKLKVIPVKMGEEFEERELRCLSSQMKQALLTKTQNAIRGLAQLKKKGHKVGRLKFKRYFSSLPLKQYGNTYRLLPEQQKIRIQGLRALLRVRGLDQIPMNAEFANAHLLQRHGDFYLSFTTYQPKESQPTLPLQGIGLDFGLKQQLTFSNGVVLNWNIPFPKRLQRLYRRFSKTQKGSKNRHKAKLKLLKEFQKYSNRKKEVRNQTVGYLKRDYQIVCFQNDPFAAWQRLWGRKMLNLSLGAMKRILKERICSPSEVAQSFASTQLCSRCGSKQNVSLDERLYQCPHCGLSIERDNNAARNIEREGLCQLGMESPEVTPAEIESSTQTMLAFFQTLPFVCASSVAEPGRLAALA
ncbi:MAG: RNA-guided endonuclease InsQ/TnpB family protein [Candidatus Hodarchaeota archaeon]